MYKLNINSLVKSRKCLVNTQVYHIKQITNLIYIFRLLLLYKFFKIILFKFFKKTQKSGDYIFFNVILNILN